MVESLTKGQVSEALKGLAGWRHEGGNLKREFKFGSFKEALSFIVRVGLSAEEQGHHPEIFNVYDRVELSLSTHEAGGVVTERDVALARAINAFAWVGPD